MIINVFTYQGRKYFFATDGKNMAVGITKKQAINNLK